MDGGALFAFLLFVLPSLLMCSPLWIWNVSLYQFPSMYLFSLSLEERGFDGGEPRAGGDDLNVRKFSLLL